MYHLGYVEAILYAPSKNAIHYQRWESRKHGLL